MLLDRVQTLCQKECGLQRDGLIVVGVSGGPDSLCLLDLLRQSDYHLLVAHANHQLRPSAHEEAQMVRRLAQQMALPFVTEDLPVQAVVDAGSSSIEEAARLLRYRFLFQQARRFGAQAVAVGHTADDQVETVLMHLLRGSGLNGLRGMEYRIINIDWDVEIPLVRPLLATWRQETMDYCTQHHLKPVMDESNLDQRYLRNRIRGELIPYLETYQPALRQGVWRMSRLLAADEAALEDLVNAAWTHTVKVGVGTVCFRRPVFLEYPVALQRRLARRAVGALRTNLGNVDALTIERMLQAVAGPPKTRQLDLALGLRMVFEGECVWLAHHTAKLPGDEWPQLAPEVHLQVEAPSELKLGAWKLVIQVEENITRANTSARESTNPFEAWLDADCAHFPLTVRRRTTGECWQPLGLITGSQKIADTMINAKLPQRARRAWPLVCTGDQVIWVPGIRPAHPARLTTDSKRALHLWMSAVNSSSE